MWNHRGEDAGSLDHENPVTRVSPGARIALQTYELASGGFRALALWFCRPPSLPEAPPHLRRKRT